MVSIRRIPLMISGSTRPMSGIVVYSLWWKWGLWLVIRTPRGPSLLTRANFYPPSRRRLLKGTDWKRVQLRLTLSLVFFFSSFILEMSTVTRKARTRTWQKLLVPSHESLRNYRRSNLRVHKGRPKYELGIYSKYRKLPLDHDSQTRVIRSRLCVAIRSTRVNY